MVAQKCSAAENSNPLLQSGVLQHVLGFVGPGHWFFLATVSSLWAELYATLASTVKHRRNMLGRVPFTCTPQMTLHSSVFASPSRMKLAHKDGVNFALRSCWKTAGRHATVPSLKLAQELGMEYCFEVMHGAAECNKLDVLQFLHAQGCAWEARISTIVAQRGDLEMLRWVHEQGCDLQTRTILSSAASSGNIELTAWVKQQPGVACNQSAMAAAAAQGHTAVCELLRAEGRPWNTHACDRAASGRHLSTLSWLHENGCAWDMYTVCYAAAQGGSVDIMVYLQQQGLATTVTVLTGMLDWAGAHHELAAAQWLREQGAEWPAVLQNWSNTAIAWARAEGCTSFAPIH
jgi:hypothetical protein